MKLNETVPANLSLGERLRNQSDSQIFQVTMRIINNQLTLLRQKLGKLGRKYDSDFPNNPPDKYGDDIATIADPQTRVLVTLMDMEFARIELSDAIEESINHINQEEAIPAYIKLGIIVKTLKVFKDTFTAINKHKADEDAEQADQRFS